MLIRLDHLLISITWPHQVKINIGQCLASVEVKRIVLEPRIAIPLTISVIYTGERTDSHPSVCPEAESAPGMLDACAPFWRSSLLYGVRVVPITCVCAEPGDATTPRSTLERRVSHPQVSEYSLCQGRAATYGDRRALSVLLFMSLLMSRFRGMRHQ